MGDITESNWYLGITYEEAKRFIDANIGQIRRSFVAIGFYLKHIRGNEMYLEDGYKSIWEFAEDRYGISRSTATRWMQMNDRFSKDGNSPILAEQYKKFSKSQLQEILYLTDEQAAELIFDLDADDQIDFCPNRPECSDGGASDEECKRCLLEWLESQIEGEENANDTSGIGIVTTEENLDKLRRPEDMTAEEAWEIAGKIILHPDIGGYTNSELEKIFGNCSKIAIFRDGTPQQAKAKIKAWETENEIKVGDIVHSIDRPGIEVMITARHKSGCYDGINAGGATHSGINIKYWKKTGRHIDIQSVLKQIGGVE